MRDSWKESALTLVILRQIEKVGKLSNMTLCDSELPIRLYGYEVSLLTKAIKEEMPQAKSTYLKGVKLNSNPMEKDGFWHKIAAHIQFEYNLPGGSIAIRTILQALNHSELPATVKKQLADSIQ